MLLDGFTGMDRVGGGFVLLDGFTGIVGGGGFVLDGFTGTDRVGGGLGGILNSVDLLSCFSLLSVVLHGGAVTRASLLVKAIPSSWTIFVDTVEATSACFVLISGTVKLSTSE